MFAVLAAPAFGGIATSFDPKVTNGHWTGANSLYSTTLGIAGLQELENYELEKMGGLIVPIGPCRILSTMDMNYQYTGVCNRSKLDGGGAPTVAYYLKCNSGETFDFSAGLCICPPPNEVFVTQTNTQICGPVVVVDKTRKRASACYGNPMLPLTGAKRETVSTGLSVAGVEWLLTYDSSSMSGGKAPADEGPAALGRLWFSTFHRRLAGRRPRPTDAPIAYRAYRGDGTVKSWPSNDRDSTDSIGFRAGDEIAYFDARGQAIEVYGAADDQLRRIVFADGRLLRFTYSTATTAATVAPAPGYLIRVEDRFGRGLDFEYQLPAGRPASTGGLLLRARQGATTVATFGYDASANLTDVTWADGQRRSFVYEDARWPWALTGVVDERRVRFSVFGYDSGGRIQSTEHAGGTDRFSVSYTTPPRVDVTEVVGADEKLTRTYSWAAPVGTVITLPNQTVSALGVTMRFGQPLVTSRDQPAGAGCAAATSTTTFDTNGFVVSEDDFNGTRTCSARLNAVSQYRVEGLPPGTDCSTVGMYDAALPTGARRITTETLSNWASPNMVTRIAEPNRITTYVFNGQADPTRGNVKTWCAPDAPLVATGLFGFAQPTPLLVVCRVVEQATTDARGTRGFAATLDTSVAPRVTTFTYNAAGQVLTEDGPRTDVADVTTYSYYTDTTADHSVGDLATVTTPAGLTTSYTAYNAAGKCLASVAGTAKTTWVYDARQRLKAMTDLSGTVVYTYDPAGRVSSVSRRGVELQTYGYDNAGQLISITDYDGNRTEYERDVMGQITTTRVKRSTGELLRTTITDFDALGRVRRQTGAIQ